MLINKVVNCKDYVAPVTDELIVSMEYHLYSSENYQSFLLILRQIAALHKNRTKPGPASNPDL